MDRSLSFLFYSSVWQISIASEVRRELKERRQTFGYLCVLFLALRFLLMTRNKGEKMLKIQSLVFDGYKNRGGFLGCYAKFMA